jgi:AraC family transcriptional regulator of adaptative response/methylated-DNA-[protein]-cysteine methyltransferase
LLLKQYYQAILDTKLGPMLAIADENALCLLEFFDRKNIERQVNSMCITQICDKRSAPIDLIEKELELYFLGKLTQFNTPICFIGTDFQQKIWRELQKIPFGETRSYLDIANKIGKPTAFRAVANANAANRLAIVVPCHRVINSNGELGGYAGGLDRKMFLINHEETYNESNA